MTKDDASTFDGTIQSPYAAMNSIRVLRIGFVGTDVRIWKCFLRGIKPNSNVIIDDKFDAVAHTETIEFQRSVGLTGPAADGVVGRITMAKAMELGFDPMLDEVPDISENGPFWPPRPSDDGPLSIDERQSLFGKFSYTLPERASLPEAIVIEKQWVKNNIVTVEVPQLRGVQGAPIHGQVLFHKKAAAQLQALFVAWDRAGFKNRVLTFAGTWVPRFVRGSRTALSNHAWGTAFDINVQWNMLGTIPALKNQKGCVRELAQIAYDNGWWWGGWFGYDQTGNCCGRSDGMHFEIRRIVTP